MLYRKWSPLLFSMEEALICAQQIHQEQNLYLKAGMTSTTNPYLYFWPIADKFKQLYPQIRLIVESDSMDILREKLENHEYDIVFLPHFEHYSLEKKELCWCWAAKDHVYAYMPDNHPLAGKNYLELADLKNYGLVILDEAHNPNYIKDINELFSGEDFKPKITKSIKNAYTIIASKRDIKDIIIADAYFDFAPSSSTVRIPVKDHFNGIICAYHRKNTSDALKKFLNIVNK